MQNILQALPQTLILGALLIVALLVLLVPISLRIAGLTGAQIIDAFTITFNAFLSIVKEFREQNKTGGGA